MRIVQQDINIHSFYNWWLLCTGAIFSLLFYLFWKLKSRENAPQDKILGIIWFSRALLIWFISGLLELLLKQFQAPLITVCLSRSICSTLNSIFILFVIPSIEVNQSAHPILKAIIEYTKHKIAVVITGSLVIAFTFCLYFLIINNGLNIEKQQYWIYLADILFSLITILSLLFVFIAAFQDQKRKMSLITVIVYVTIILTIYAEISLTFPSWALSSWFTDSTHALLYYLSATLFKSLLITLFVALLYSYEIKKAVEYQSGQLLPYDKIKARWNLDEKEVKVLRLLAQGKSRKEIGSMSDIFPNQRSDPSKSVHDMLPGIANKFQITNDIGAILLYALHHHIVNYSSDNQLQANER